MIIKCENCRASYRLDLAMFRGSKGMAVRCRRCGKSIHVLKPEGIASDMSVLDGLAPEGDHSGNGSTEPAVSPAKEEYSPPLEVEQVPPVEEQARILRREWEVEEFSVAEAGKSPPGSVQTFGSIIIYPPFPKSPPENDRRHTFIWPSIVASVLLFILLVGGTVFLVSPSLGKGLLADIGKRIEQVNTIFRS